MSIPPKPFTISWPLTAQQAQDLDRMFVELYDELALLDQNGTSGSSSASTGPSMAQVLTRVIHGT